MDPGKMCLEIVLLSILSNPYISCEQASLCGHCSLPPESSNSTTPTGSRPG